VAVVPLTESEIRPRRRREILHVREVAATPPEGSSDADAVGAEEPPAGTHRGLA
jgi:hypothetical protein